MFKQNFINIAAIIPHITCAVLAAILFFSCADMPTAELPFKDMEAAPSQSMYNSSSMFTDSGRVQLKMEYKMLYSFDYGEAYQVFPEGIVATFYDEEGLKNLDLFADSAINLQEEELMKFYKNVVIYDYRTSDTIYTEALYWNQESKTIHSDVYVKKVSPNMVLEGDGFDADEQMNNVVLRKPRGVVL